MIFLNENITENTITSTTIDSKVSNIETQVNAIMQADLFLVAFLVSCVVIYLLYKAVDNFISY